MKVKTFLALVFSCLFLSTSFAATSYNTVEEFEKAEGAICESATDGCNSFFLNDGKVAGGTLKLCMDVTPAWTCTKYKETPKVYSTMEAFEKAEGAMCKSATDGCNTYFMTSDGKVGGGTLMYCEDVYGEGKQEKWSCLSYSSNDTNKTETPAKSYKNVDDFEKAEGLTCVAATDGCNDFFIGKNGKVGGGTLKACQNHVAEWKCTKRDDMIYVLSGTDLESYLEIKAGKLSPEAIVLVSEYTQKYMDKLSKMDNVAKKNNLDALTVTIEQYATALVKKERYSRSLEMKVNVLNLLKYNFQKEIYLMEQQEAAAANTEKETTGSGSTAKMHFSWDLDNDGLNDCEKEDLCDHTVDYTVPRIFTYTCDNNEQFSFQYQTRDEIVLNDNKTKRFYYLDRVTSADGEKFEDETNIIWLKSDSVLFERGGEEYYTNCSLKR